MDENERVDSAAKEVTGWRKVKKRNGKLIKVDINHILPSLNLPFLKFVMKALLTEKLYIK